MKQNFKPRGTLVAALDLGSQKIACLIAQVIDDHGGIDILGAGYQASKGIKDGVITDLAEADNALRHAVHVAEKMAAPAMKGYPLRDVVVNVPAVGLSSDRVSFTIKIGGHSITEKDMTKALAESQAELSKDGHELVHTILTECILDGANHIQDPIGMVGDVLEPSIHVITAPSGPLQNIAQTVEKSHLDIMALCSSAYASGLACLVDDEMDLGCTLIDIGATSTAIAIFRGGKLLHLDTVPLGGSHITSDIANGLSCAVHEAERIKTLYGSAILGNSDEEELIDVPRLGEEDDPDAHVSRAILIGIIQPRVEEILEMIRDKLQDSPYGKSLSRKVVLTGGGSQMAGIRELAQIVLEKQVRLGRPIRISGLPDAASGPNFATCAGLLTYYVERAHEKPTEISMQADSASPWMKFKNWWKENW